MPRAASQGALSRTAHGRGSYGCSRVRCGCHGGGAGYRAQYTPRRSDPYKRDLPEVEFHLIDIGHFALEDKADEMVLLIRDFLGRKVK
jgi:hypothetical protein